MKREEKAQEQEMLTTFLKQAENITASEDRFIKTGDGLLIGFESEIAIHRENLLPAELENVRDTIIREVPDIADVELGAGAKKYIALLFIF